MASLFRDTQEVKDTELGAPPQGFPGCRPTPGWSAQTGSSQACSVQGNYYCEILRLTGRVFSGYDDDIRVRLARPDQMGHICSRWWRAYFFIRGIRGIKHQVGRNMNDLIVL